MRAQAAPRDAEQVAGSEDRKRVIITGGNTGLGFETAKALAMSGYQEIVLACRNAEKGEAAAKKLSAAAPAGVSFKNELLCLDDLSSVRDFVKRMQDDSTPIDVLLNNAGVMACPEAQTKDGFEYQLGVNHLGHFVLTAGLLPLMSDPARSTRIVNVSSLAQLWGDINFDDPNYKNGYQAWTAYGQSKLANAMFSLELSNRIPVSANVTSNSLHPGIVNTELSRHIKADNTSAVADFLLQGMAKILGMKTPEEGAQTQIYMARSPEVEGITGKYYIDSKPAIASWKVYNDDTRKRFWDLSCEMTGETFDVEALTSGSAAVKA